jgi:hypothetical protein
VLTIVIARMSWLANEGAQFVPCLLQLDNAHFPPTVKPGCFTGEAAEAAERGIVSGLRVTLWR